MIPRNILFRLNGVTQEYTVTKDFGVVEVNDQEFCLCISKSIEPVSAVLCIYKKFFIF